MYTQNRNLELLRGTEMNAFTHVRALGKLLLAAAATLVVADR